MYGCHVEVTENGFVAENVILYGEISGLLKTAKSKKKRISSTISRFSFFLFSSRSC
jgi:hypothetical protein